MPSAPLKVTVQIHLQEGPASGQRRFRLSRRIELPPALTFDRGLPVEGEALGEVTFGLPGHPDEIGALARLYYDPDHPERGTQAELLDLPPQIVQALQTYIEQRMNQ